MPVSRPEAADADERDDTCCLRRISITSAGLRADPDGSTATWCNRHTQGHHHHSPELRRCGDPGTATIMLKKDDGGPIGGLEPYGDLQQRGRAEDGELFSTMATRGS